MFKKRELSDKQLSQIKEFGERLGKNQTLAQYITRINVVGRNNPIRFFIILLTGFICIFILNEVIIRVVIPSEKVVKTEVNISNKKDSIDIKDFSFIPNQQNNQ